MAAGAELAQALVDYDRQLAFDLLERICEELGGPASHGNNDVDAMRSFLSSPRATGAGDDMTTTTEEWKRSFGHLERARALGMALAERLR
jgi:hypothetical protein